jgi:hypothetical protein
MVKAKSSRAIHAAIKNVKYLFRDQAALNLVHMKRKTQNKDRVDMR